MGRKKKEKVGSFDRIGEEVNLEKCPECVEHPDCFAWMEGRCTALKETGGRGCVFYCPAEKAIAEARMCIRKLMEQHRTDLIQKYFKSLSALGQLDEEIDAVRPGASGHRQRALAGHLERWPRRFRQPQKHLRLPCPLRGGHKGAFGPLLGYVRNKALRLTKLLCAFTMAHEKADCSR